MILSKPKCKVVQPYLFDVLLGNHGHVRTVIGNLCERLTVERFPGAVQHRTDSRCDYCPDISWQSMYFEVKAAGRTRQTFIYEGRLHKDREFNKHHNLWYIVWHHLAKTKSVDTVRGLEELVLKMMKAVYVVPFSAIDAICQTMRPEKLNSKYGPGGNTYGSGYRIPVKRLAEWMV